MKYVVLILIVFTGLTVAALIVNSRVGERVPPD